MGSMSKMATKCQNCPIREICEKKQMEAAAYLTESAAAPASRETMQINVGDIMATVYKDEIKKSIYAELNKPFLLNYGA